MNHFYKTLFCLTLLLALRWTASGQEAWRSVLYPFSWERGLQVDGKFLHDFSFAGYHYGEQAIPDSQLLVLDVTQAPFLADASGTTDATQAIQQAIDSVGRAGGGVVFLPEGTYQLNVTGSNGLTITQNHTVIRGAGPDKTFLLNTTTHMRSKNLILFAGSGAWYASAGAGAHLTQDAVEQDTIIHLTNAAAFATGDRIVLTSDFTTEFIAEHQMTGKWTTSMEGVAFCRTVKEVNAGENWIRVDIPVRYYLKMRDRARAYKVGAHLVESGIENLSIGNLQNPKSGLGDSDFNVSGTAAYEVHGSHLVQFRYAENCWMHRVNTFKPEANTSDIHLLSNGVLLFQSRLVTIDSCIFQKPQYEGEGGNGYLFTLQSNDCLIKNTQAIHSRHNYNFKKPFCNGNVIHNSLSKDSRLATDFHMHLSMTNLFDNHTVDNDFLEAVYRPYGTVEHGHTTTQSVFWNTQGLRYHGNSSRIIASGQWKQGYVIGTRGAATGVARPVDNNTGPQDHLEGEGLADALHPASLYLDQMQRRTKGRRAVDSTNWDAPAIRWDAPVTDARLDQQNITLKIAILNGEVSKIAYHANGEWLGESDTAPFDFQWESPADGCYALTAQAFAATGSASVPVSVEVFVGRGCEESYYGYAFPLPGKVEAEFFNKGKNHHGYYDTDDTNQGGAYRSAEPVDIERCTDTGAGFNVGWIATGEYLRYVVEVAADGLYTLGFRTASQNSGTVQFAFSGQPVSGTVNVPSTGGWQNWRTVTSEEVELRAGVDTLQLSFTGGFNLNYLEATQIEREVPLSVNSAKCHVFPNPARNQIQVRALQKVNSWILHDLAGRPILEAPAGSQSFTINVSSLKSGVYLLTLWSENGSEVYRILKE